MKNLILLLLFFVATICSAQEVERNIEGKYRVVIDTDKWQQTDITADEKTRFYTKFFPRAIENPNSIVLVTRYVETLKLVSLFKRLVEVEEHFILYNDVDKKIHYIGPEKKEEILTSLLMLPVLLSFILITTGIILRIYKKKYTLPFFWLATSTSFLSYLLPIANFFWGPIFFLLALVSLLTCASFIAKKKIPTIPIILYYLFLISGSISLFIGI